MPRYQLALGVAALLVVCSSARGEDALATELGKGHSGPEVRALQRALNLYGSRLDVAGVFEDGTERAVRRFQRLHDLEASGVADAATLERLMQPLKLGDSGSAVRRLQRLLEAPATGVFRTSTLDAVKTFQRKHDLEATGEFSPRLLGLFDDDPEAVLPDEDEETDAQKQEEDGTRTGTAAGTPGGATPGFDELGQASDSGSKGSSGSKVGDKLEDLFSGLAKSSKSAGGGQFAPGQGQDPTRASAGSSTGGASSSGKPLGGGIGQREDPLAHVNQRDKTQTGQRGGSQTSQQGGSQTGGSQTGQQGGSQSGQQGGSQSGDVFTSKQLPFRDFKSLTELASALEVLKAIEQIQEALAKGTIEEPLVQAMRAMQGKLKGQQAKALIDLAIKVYEIPGPNGKNTYVQPALTAVLKAKAVEIGAVPTGPGPNATAKQTAAHDAQVAARFPGLK